MTGGGSWIGWMAGNRVAANLLMLFLLVGGGILSLQSKQEVFPEFTADTVRVGTTWSGASPTEVERNLTMPLEEAIRSVDGVKRMTSESSEGISSISVELLDGVDADRVRDDIEEEVGTVTGLPDGADDPVVEGMDRSRSVLSVLVYGPLSRVGLWESAYDLRDAMLSSGVSKVEIGTSGERVIRVRPDRETLARLGLAPSDVSQALQEAAAERPAGEMKGESGDVLVKSGTGLSAIGDVRRVVVSAAGSGAVVTVSEVADVEMDIDVDGPFTDYDGKTAVRLNVYRIGNQTPGGVSKAARSALDAFSAGHPGMDYRVVNDMSETFDGRMSMLLWNGATGLVLVFVVLGLFLDGRTAAWVALGIPVSFMGVFLLLSAAGVSVNMISMFAFLIALGIVVDDAIVVGESVHALKEKGVEPVKAAVTGAASIAVPVTFSVLTNMATFAPLLFLPGVMGKIMFCVPVVVIGVFGISLVESLFILPAHLSRRPAAGVSGIRKVADAAMAALSARVYGPVLRAALSFRYAAVAVACVCLALAAAMVVSGRVKVMFMPRVESDFAYAKVTMPPGTPDSTVAEIGRILSASAKKELGDEPGGVYVSTSGDTAEVTVYLEDTSLSTAGFVSGWRNGTPAITGAKSSLFQSDRGGPGAGKAFSLELSMADRDRLALAATDLASMLADYPGVKDVDSGVGGGKPSVTYVLSKAGRDAGLSQNDMATALAGFFDETEAYAVRDDRGEIKVKVGLDGRFSRDPGRLEIPLPGGGFMPLSKAAETTYGVEPVSVSRIDGRRALTVSADLENSEEAGTLMSSVLAGDLPVLAKRYPGLSWDVGGRRRNLNEGVSGLFSGLSVALLAVYALLAIPFRSYFQPFVVMTAIPFGMVGAVAGHLLMGCPLSLQSLLGMVALSGVVVNDSLVLTDAYNRERASGKGFRDAVSAATASRFRAIMLTTMTTFFGLAPMIVDRSTEAAFLAPMAISLGFGIVVATLVTLVLVPCFLGVGDDVRRLLRR